MIGYLAGGQLSAVALLTVIRCTGDDAAALLVGLFSLIVFGSAAAWGAYARSPWIRMIVWACAGVGLLFGVSEHVTITWLILAGIMALGFAFLGYRRTPDNQSEEGVSSEESSPTNA